MSVSRITYIQIHTIVTHARIGVSNNEADIIFNNMWIKVT